MYEHYRIDNEETRKKYKHLIDILQEFLMPRGMNNILNLYYQDFCTDK